MTNAQTPSKYATYDGIVISKNSKLGGITMSEGYHGGGFALIVVLFILLIIVGASWF